MLAPYIYTEIKILLEANPRYRYLEIGSFDGEGIASLAKEFPSRKFYCIDPFLEDGNTSHITLLNRGQKLDKVYKKFRQNIDGIKNIMHYKMTTERFIDLYHNKLPDIDVLLIDGDHSFFGASVDLKLATMFAEKKNITVYMDDINKPSVNKAFTFFKDLHNIRSHETNCVDLIYFKL